MSEGFDTVYGRMVSVKFGEMKIGDSIAALTVNTHSTLPHFRAKTCSTHSRIV